MVAALGPAGSDEFFAKVLDSLQQQIAVIDRQGVLQWVNRAWIAFYVENGGDSEKVWPGTSYIGVCNQAAEEGDLSGGDAVSGILSVLRDEKAFFHLEYPCHSPTEQRWFMMSVRRIDWDGPDRFVVTHQNITKRKLKEIEAQELATVDSLTGVASRGHFDDFLVSEWQRALRLGHPLSLALIDVDEFKRFNDRYGHLAGDNCLHQVAEVLRLGCRRPGDLAARYGGDEFALIFGNTDREAALVLTHRIHRAAQDLAIPFEGAFGPGRVTVSVGVATLFPINDGTLTPLSLIAAADQALYQAKENGRNCVIAQDGHATVAGPASPSTNKYANG